MAAHKNGTQRSPTTRFPEKAKPLPEGRFLALRFHMPGSQVNIAAEPVMVAIRVSEFNTGQIFFGFSKRRPKVPGIRRIAIGIANCRLQIELFGDIGPSHQPDARARIEQETGQILGAHVIGPGAEEQINLFALAMGAGLSANQIKGMIFAYPSHASDLGSMV